MNALAFVPLDDFVTVSEPSALPLIGTDDENVLPADGTALMYGDGGTGKTTVTLDAVAHMAAGSPWLGLPVHKPLRILVIENEGPRGPFRRKLARKLEHWEGPPFAANVFVLEEPWALFNIADEQHRCELQEFVRTHDINLIVAGPIATLGMVGGGTPDEINAFDAHLKAFRAGLEQPVAFWLIHHENKAGDVSGAWERVPDTMIHVRATGKERTQLHWRKVRYGSRTHDAKMTLRWLIESEGFELIDSELESAAKRATEEAIASEWLARYVEDHPGEARGKVETAFHEAHENRGRNLARRVIDKAILAIRTGECHEWLTLGPGESQRGVYLYPSQGAYSPLAATPLGEYGEWLSPLSQTPPEKAHSPLAAPLKGGESGGEWRTRSAGTLQELSEERR